MNSSPIGSVDDALQRNFKMGVVAGMLAAVNLPNILIEIDREAFNQLLENMRDGN